MFLSEAEVFFVDTTVAILSAFCAKHEKLKRCEHSALKSLYEGLNLSGQKLWYNFLLFYCIANIPSSSLKELCSC